MLALVLFFVIGCCGAVLLGRLSDIVDYLLYIDKKTGMPNREKLNIYIGEMAGKVLPEAFTCFTLNLDNLVRTDKAVRIYRRRWRVKGFRRTGTADGRYGRHERI